VVKRLDSPYRPGRRSPEWLKIKNRRLLDVVVGGISPGRGHRAGQIGSLLVGVPGPGGLAYAGRVGTGFTQRELRRLEQLLAPLRRDRAPFADPVPPGQARDVTWVEPRVVIEVSYAELTPDGILRAASYQGIAARSTGRGTVTLGTGTLALSGPVAGTRPCSPSSRPRSSVPPSSGPSFVGAALLGAEDVGTPWFRTKLIGTAGLGAEHACARPGLVRGPGIACHVNLLHGCCFGSCPA